MAVTKGCGWREVRSLLYGVGLQVGRRARWTLGRLHLLWMNLMLLMHTRTVDML